MPLAAIDHFSPWRHCPLQDAQFWIGDYQLCIDLLLNAKTSAGGTSTMRTVKTERAWCNFRQANPTVDTGSLLGEENLFTIDDRDQHNPISELECCLQRIAQALTKRWINVFLYLCLLG